jgi:4-amino-4-deoxy-L-arabinose transferase-like glycosyltransferase
MLALAAVWILHNLSSGSLPPFDDTTYALIAKTILKTGDWITMRWLDLPYFFSGKPPLNFWLTAFFYKIFGISEFSSRLSTALHGIAGIAVAYFIGALYSPRIGLVSAAFLMSFPDYFRLSQSAMLDIPLTVYMTLSLLFYLRACRDLSMKYYYLSGIACGLAIMTKSVVGIAPLLVIGLFHIAEGKPRALLSKRLAVVVASCILVALPWHIWEYLRYGRAFVTKYLFGTISHTLTDVLVTAHRSSPTFYLRILYTNEPVHLLLCVASLAPLFTLALQKNRESLLLLIYIAFLLVLFSSFDTRMAWYITPAFPAMAVSSALLVSRLSQAGDFGRSLSLVLAAAFVMQMASLWREDHWYLHGDPDLRQIAQDFKVKSSPDDVLVSYGFGDAVNAGPFYGDRKVVFLTSSRDELMVQKRIEDYLQAGLVEYVADERSLIQKLCSTRYRHVIFRNETYERFKEELRSTGANPIAQNQSYVIARFSCANYN